MKKNNEDVFFAWLKRQVFGEQLTDFKPDWQAFEKHRRKKFFFLRLKLATGFFLLMAFVSYLGSGLFWEKNKETTITPPAVSIVGSVSSAEVPEEYAKEPNSKEIVPKLNGRAGVDQNNENDYQGATEETKRINPKIIASSPQSNAFFASEVASGNGSEIKHDRNVNPAIAQDSALASTQKASQSSKEANSLENSANPTNYPEHTSDSEAFRVLANSPEGEIVLNQDYSLASLVPEDPKWAFQLSIYPSFTFRELGINPGRVESVHKDYQSITNTSEKTGFAVNAGLDISYNFKRDLFITTGFYYIQHKIGGRYNFSNDLRPIVQDGIIQDYEQGVPVFVDRNIFNTYHYINIPVLLSYQPWASKKIRIKMEGGISTLIFAGAEGITLDPQSLAIRESGDLDYRRLLFSLNIRIGAAYLINKNVMFGLEPSLLYFNNSIYRDPDHPVYMVPYAVGLNANLRILLN
jgi:hypothetical protein